MRRYQIAQEELNMKQTGISEFMDGIDDNKSSCVIKDMVELVSSGVEAYSDSVQRKRASFFKVTKSLSYESIAYIGLKGLIGTMSLTQSMAVTTIGQRIGDALYVATGREGEIYSIDKDVVVEKTGAGIKLLDIVINSLPIGYFRTECERVSKTSSVWTVITGDGYDKLRKTHSDVLASFSKRMAPLVCQPDDWEGMVGGGYLSDIAKKVTPLVKRMPEHPSPKGDIIFKAINHIQKTPFRVHKKIFKVCKELQEIRPSQMKKVFMEDIGTFDEVCPIDQVSDSYLWEKVEGTKVDKKTGKSVESLVMKYQGDNDKYKRKEFFKWAARRSLHKKKILARKSIDKSYEATLELTKGLEIFDEIFWGYQLDRRGRVYPSAMTGINLQGADYQKAVVEFAVGFPLKDKDGVYGIVKTLCNHWGGDGGNGVKTDKLARQDAEIWVKESTQWILDCAENPLNSSKWMLADKPLQFLAAAFEWSGWVKYKNSHPNEFGYISHLADPNDASCSGAQILSAMTRDLVGARHTNLLNMPVQDLYMAVASKITENLLKNFSTDEMCQDWLGRKNVLEAINCVVRGDGHEVLTNETQDKILSLWGEGLSIESIYLKIYLGMSEVEQGRLSLVIRDLVKKPVMVKFYSGTRYGNIEHCSEFIISNEWDEHFRCDGTSKAAAFMGGMIFDSINQVVKGAGLVMEWFVHVADVLGSKNKAVKWTTPVGFRASLKKLATKDVKFRVLWKGSDTRFTIKTPVKVATDQGWEYKLDVKKMKSGIAPDIVHSLDAALILKVGERCSREGIDNLWLVHDSLASHCCFSQRFNRIIREEFVDLFKEDILDNMYKGFRDQLDEEDQDLLLSPEKFGIKRGGYILEEILDSEFCFH